MQLREGVRTEAEALALGHEVQACPALHLRGLMTHHGNLNTFQPIIKAFKAAFGQVRVFYGSGLTAGGCYCSCTALFHSLGRTPASPYRLKTRTHWRPEELPHNV